MKIPGTVFFVVAPDFEGLAEALRVNNDDTVTVRSEWSGALYTVEKCHLYEDEPREDAHNDTD